MMETIKFKYNFVKLFNQSEGVLIYIRSIKKPPFQLINYSTSNNEEVYTLRDYETYLQLVFLGNYGIPISTLRRYTKHKEEFYYSYVGMNFKFEIENN